MTKIVIASEKDMIRQTIADVKNKVEQKEGKILYFDSVDDLRKVITTQRINLLRVIRREKPASLYALAKLLRRDFKSVVMDIRLLENFGLVSLDKYSEHMKVKIKPSVKANSLSVNISMR